MKFTLSWLKEHLDTTASVDEILAYVEAELAACPNHRRIVLTTAGVAPPGCPADTFRAVGERIRALALLHGDGVSLHAIDSGVNYLDTAYPYHGGNSETAIGKALKEWKGGRIIIQTKTPWYNEEPTEYFEKLLYEALEKLGVDCIDYLLTQADLRDGTILLRCGKKKFHRLVATPE